MVIPMIGVFVTGLLSLLLLIEYGATPWVAKTNHGNLVDTFHVVALGHIELGILAVGWDESRILSCVMHCLRKLATASMVCVIVMILIFTVMDTGAMVAWKYPVQCAVAWIATVTLMTWNVVIMSGDYVLWALSRNHFWVDLIRRFLIRHGTTRLSPRKDCNSLARIHPYEYIIFLCAENLSLDYLGSKRLHQYGAVSLLALQQRFLPFSQKLVFWAKILIIALFCM